MKSSLEEAVEFARALDNKRALDIQVLDVRHLTIITDYMVLASARSTLAVKALSDELDEKLGAPARRDGYHDGRWIVMDYGMVLVHLFHEEERQFYNLERLWTDGSNSVQWEA